MKQQPQPYAWRNNRNTQYAQARFSVGARADDEGMGGPLWSPAGWGVALFPQHGSAMNRTRATIKALPAPHPPLSPLRMLMGFSSADAYWRAFKVARGEGRGPVAASCQRDEQDAGDPKGQRMLKPIGQPL